MMKYILHSITLLSCTMLMSFHIDNVATKKSAKKQGVLLGNTHTFFKKAPLHIANDVAITTDPENLMRAAQDTLTYLNHHMHKTQITDPVAWQKLLPLDEVKRTLQFIIDTGEEDIKTGESRLQNPEFIKEHFATLHWKADKTSAREHAITIPDNGKIRLTSYGILEVHGNQRKTNEYNCALYALFDSSIRTSFTKQQILAGALEKKIHRSKVGALAWLTRDGFEDALMQGTVIVMFPDGSKKMFNVNTHNNIPYDRSQKNVREQKRYWFFRPLQKGNDDFDTMYERMKRRRNVIFAGDLYNIGAGKLIALTHKNPLTQKREMVLGILADTGGAFMKNLYQLDLFGGVFADKSELTHHLKQFPPFTRASILYLKP